MEQEVKKRTRRSKDQIAQEKIQKLEAKMTDYESKIAEAKKEIESLKNPPAPTVKWSDLRKRAEELGVTPEEILAFIEKTGKKKNQE